MTVDIPNAPERKNNEDPVVVKITGAHVVYIKSEKVLYVVVLHAIYGMVQAAILSYKKFRCDLEDIGLELSPYDPCVANRVVNGSQHNVIFALTI